MADGSAAWIQAISEAFSALFSFILLAGLLFGYRQIRDANSWNKINNAFNFFNFSGFSQQEKEFFDVLMKLGIDLTTQTEELSSKELQKLWNDPNAYKITQDYLNLLENFAFGIRIGALDEDCSFELNCARIVRIAFIFRPFIKKYQVSVGSAAFYNELYSLYHRWEPKMGKSASTS
jgi:hypothetical protein